MQQERADEAGDQPAPAPRDRDAALARSASSGSRPTQLHMVAPGPDGRVGDRAGGCSADAPPRSVVRAPVDAETESPVAEQPAHRLAHDAEAPARRRRGRRSSLWSVGDRSAARLPAGLRARRAGGARRAPADADDRRAGQARRDSRSRAAGCSPTASTPTRSTPCPPEIDDPDHGGRGAVRRARRLRRAGARRRWPSGSGSGQAFVVRAPAGRRPSRRAAWPRSSSRASAS